MDFERQDLDLFGVATQQMVWKDSHSDCFQAIFDPIDLACFLAEPIAFKEQFIGLVRQATDQLLKHHLLSQVRCHPSSSE